MINYIILTEEECYELYMDRSVQYKNKADNKTYVLCSEEFFKSFNMIKDNEEEVTE